MHRLVIGVLAGLVLASSGGSAAAQLKLGLKGGVNVSTVGNLESAINSGSNADFTGGAYVSYTSASAVALQGELLYSRRSSDLEDTAIDEKSQVTQNFIEIPVLLGYRFIPDGMLQPMTYLGASASFETSCDVDLEDVDTSGDCSDFFGADTKSTQWAGIIGALLDIDVGPVVLTADARYNYGFSKISGEGDAQWRYFSFMAGIGLGF
jgi:hypothetical protein